MSKLSHADASGAPRRSLRSILLAVWSQGPEQRLIRNVTADERATSHPRALANVQTACASPDPALDECCRDSARAQLGRRGP